MQNLLVKLSETIRSLIDKHLPVTIFLLSGLWGCGGDPLLHEPKQDTATQQADGLDLRQRVRRVVLENGMTFLLLRREGAPFFAAEIRVKVGSIEEDAGHTGLAHFFEHMAFKGTDTIGTRDFAKEKPLLDKVLAVGTQITTLKKQGKSASDLATLSAELKTLTEDENKFINKNEFVEIFQKNGGTNLNATTSNDFTTYYVSLPSSKLELWAYMESRRLNTRVLREFFTERDVVAEERRMRYDNAPEGRLYEALMAKAFDKSPYKTIAIGKAADIQNYTPDAAMAFYKKYYIPSRMKVALVGNFDLDAAEKIVRQYFAILPAREDVKREFAKEVFDDTFPRSVTITGPDKPRFYLAFHRVANPDPDDEVFDVLQEILCEGRTSRLYRKLVLEEKRVAAVDCFSSMPAARLDSLFAFFAMPLEGHTSKEIESLILAEIKRLADEGPTTEEMDIVKNNIDADFIYSLESNEGLASKLTFYESLTGDWQYIYHFQKRVHEITAEDIQRVLKTYFVKERRVSAYLEQKK